MSEPESRAMGSESFAVRAEIFNSAAIYLTLKLLSSKNCVSSTVSSFIQRAGRAARGLAVFFVEKSVYNVDLSKLNHVDISFAESEA